MRLITAVMVIFMAGCAGQQFRYEAKAPTSDDKQRLDLLDCRQLTKEKMETPANFATGFIMGFTIIGLPFDMERTAQMEKQIFSDCMAMRGYAITSFEDSVNRCVSASYVIGQKFSTTEGKTGVIKALYGRCSACTQSGFPICADATYE